MHQTAVPSAVWQRRTNKIIAAGITIIGLTMMLSLIPQCIYIGVVFVACALIWLGWMTMKEKKVEPPRPEGQHPASPVLFLVASHHLRQSSRGPTLPDPEDKPPSYEQILKLDGLPPDYYSVLSEKPPRYEDLSPTLGWGACALPVEFYAADLPCVHSSAHSSSPDSPVSLEVPMHAESTSSFLQGLPSSWSTQSVLPSSYSSNQAFGTENPAFSSQSLNNGISESSNVKAGAETAPVEGERRDTEKDEENKLNADFSNI
ncbi:uncharacterized protein LOC125042991 [Penaeus chinensis]|uniref:uncharacterized protein LOC125042991 n=1 Tax=Penaeus chinensis TaxID=139456 RepID=UPI001FB573A2|nr:uncharacterized protein LOC125042991 [Penaeus chinensis]XP_047494861.1 uncharacterized protein LOC125042991 [Penaeus chinensis]